MATLDFTWADGEARTGQINGSQSDSPKDSTGGKLQRIADKNGADNARAAEILKQHQANIRHTTKLRADIMSGLQHGEDIHGLFLKAVEALGLCISDPTLYDRVQSTLTAVYGAGLREPAPLSIEREAVAGRLEKLTAAAERCTDDRSKAQIQKAIAAHKQRLEDLK